MAAKTQMAEEGLDAPATKRELLLVKADLEDRMDRMEDRMEQMEERLQGQITEVKADLKQVKADLKADMDDQSESLRAEIASAAKGVELKLTRIAWTAVATLGAIGILLRFF